MIQFDGYPFENHEVITPDLYVLNLHRIPHGKYDNQTRVRPVAFLGTCLYCSSAAYVLVDQEKSLGKSLISIPLDFIEKKMKMVKGYFVEDFLFKSL